MSDVRNELAKLVSYVFQTRGKRRISETDWTQVLSLERRWFAPAPARLLLSVARGMGLVHNAGQTDLEVGLEAEALPLAVDYRPPEHLAEQAAQGNRAGPVPGREAPLFRRIVASLAKQLGQAEGEIVSRANAAQQTFGGLLRIEVAALYYGALQGAKVSEFVEEAERAAAHVPK